MEAELARISNMDGQSDSEILQSEDSLTCDYCGMCFSQKSQLQDHWKAHYARAKMIYCCGLCGKFMKKRSQLIEHKRIHSGERPFSCSICGRGFYRKHNLKKHRSVHEDKPFACRKCYTSFRQKEDLVKHQERHLRTSLCSECGDSFTDTKKLKRHQRTHKNMIYFCDKCDILFSEEDKVRQLQSEHKHRLCCPACEKYFADERSFAKHRSLYARPSSKSHCKHCGKNLNSCANLFHVCDNENIILGIVETNPEDPIQDFEVKEEMDISETFYEIKKEIAEHEIFMEKSSHGIKKELIEHESDSGEFSNDEKEVVEHEIQPEKSKKVKELIKHEIHSEEFSHDQRELIKHEIYPEESNQVKKEVEVVGYEIFLENPSHEELQSSMTANIQAESDHLLEADVDPLEV